MKSRSAIALVALGLAVGCKDNTGPLFEGVQIAPLVNSPTLVLGDTVRVEVVVANYRTEPITIETNTCNEHFVVQDERGVIIPTVEPLTCTAGSKPVTLQVGESHSLFGFWSGRLGDDVAPIGNYRIHGRVVVKEFDKPVLGGSTSVAVVVQRDGGSAARMTP